MAASSLVFAIHGERLAIARLPAAAPIPDWARGSFLNIARTAGELSIVCAQQHVPADVQQERDRIGFGIVGVVPMTTIGLLASLCGALAGARVPVFAISTFDTDYLLVRAADFAAAQLALEELGHHFTGTPPA